MKGKILITTDWHFGIKQNSISRLNILLKVVKEMSKFIKKNKVGTLLFCGDLFHARNVLSVQTIDVALRCMEALAKQCRVVLVLGNHDIFNKNTVDVNSSSIFRNIKNVEIVSAPTECEINGEKCLLCPWLSDLSAFEKDSYSMLFGHFDISAEFLIASYVEHNKTRNGSTEELKAMIDGDELLKESGIDDLDFETENTENTFINNKPSSELIGDWIELAKEGGTIFSGHIHNHREFYAKSRKFIFIGSPYQQTLGEMTSEDGFYTLDESNGIEFHKLDGIPVHRELVMSKIASDPDNFDYGVVTGNILHRIYDVDIDRQLDAKISQRIADKKPYEELTPDYNLQTCSYDANLSSDSVDLIRKSKLEYLRNYISNIDDSVMKENDLEREGLYKVMTEYYDMVNEGASR